MGSESVQYKWCPVKKPKVPEMTETRIIHYFSRESLMNYKKMFGAVAAAVALYGVAGQASAALMLTLENPASLQYQ